MNSAQPKTTTMRRYRSCRSQRAAADSSTSATRIAQRVGFTLVELLMVIVIIGILIGMLAVAINPVLQSSREFAVAQEMKQMDSAIESFNTKYGFYPPSFTGFNQTATGTGAQLLPYLNKISPNHRELNPMFPGGLSRLEIWWRAIGSNLDDRGSLIFWLSGLSANKQFPITGNLPMVNISGDQLVAGTNFAQLPIIANADFVIVVDAMGVVQPGGNNSEFDIFGTIERDSLFDFRGAQLTRTGALPGIRIYNQPFGNQKGNLGYFYRNSAFYADPQGTAGVAYHVFTDGTPPQVWLNPNTFQISTFGLDGRPSQYVDPNSGELLNFRPTAINKPSSGTAEQRKGWQEFTGDNITNFAAGRLDAFDWTEAVELGTRNPE